MKTILHVIDIFNVGGAQNLLVLLSKTGEGKAYRHLICVLQPNCDLENRAVAHGVRTICLNRERPSILCPHRLLHYIYGNVRDILSLCRRESVDVIHCHLSDAEFIGGLVGKIWKKAQIISSIHGPELLPPRSRGDVRNRMRIWATAWIYRWVDSIVAVSDEVATRLKQTFRVPGEKIHVIVNGIDCERFANASADRSARAALDLAPTDRVLLHTGRLAPAKGQEYLIRAMAELVHRYPDTKLLVAGDGPLGPRLRSRCHEVGVAEHVRFLGNREDIPRLLAVSDIFVLPSIREGTSLALLEAMAAGKPVVATDIPGNRAVVSHGISGILVPSADAPALAGALDRLLADPAQANKMGEAAAAAVQRRYDIAQTVAKLEKLWKVDP